MSEVPSGPKRWNSEFLREASFAWPVLLIVLIAAGLWMQLGSLLSASRWISRTNGIIAQTYEVEKLAVDLQTSFRGYLYTGVQSFLEPYQRAQRMLPPRIAQLKATLADNPHQLDELSAFEHSLIRWETYSQDLILLRGQGGDPRPIMATGRGEHIMDEIREQLSTIVAENERLLKERSRTAHRASDVFRGVSLLALLAVVLFAIRSLRVRRRFEDALSLWMNTVRAADWAVAVGSPRANRFVLMNPAFARLFGWTVDELMQQPLEALYPAESLDRRAELLQKVDSEGHLVFEFTAIRKDGSRFPALVDSTAVRDADGRVLFRVSHIRDLTETKRAQEALEHSERLLNSVIERIPVGLCILRRDGSIVRANPALSEIWGGIKQVTPERYSEYPAWDYESGRRLRSEDWGAYQALREGKDVLGQILRIHTFDGREKVVLNSVFPLRDSEGAVAAAVVLNEDITVRKRVETQEKFLIRMSQELAQRLDFNHSLAKIAELAVPALADWSFVDVVTDGVVRKLGVFHRDPALEEKARSVFKDSPASQRSVGGVYSCLRSGKPVFEPRVTEEILERVVPEKDRRDLTREIGMRSYIIVPIRGRDRIFGTLSFLSSSREYTEDDLSFAEEIGARAGLLIDNARLFQEAQRAIRVREETLATVAHDLKNPLAAIRIAMQLLPRILPSVQHANEREAKVLALGSQVTQATAQAERLIRDLVDLARMESGTFAIERKPVCVNELLRDAMSAQQLLADDKQLAVRLVTELSDDEIVSGDRDRLGQVLANLLGNAIKFTPRGGRIDLEASRSDPEEIRIGIHDSGPGIAGDALPHIFERYWQAESTRSLGTGLGLSIAKGLVESHGGRIWAQSKLGGGALFCFTLPSRAQAGLFFQTPRAGKVGVRHSS